MSSDQSHTSTADNVASRLFITFVLTLWVSTAWGQQFPPIPAFGLFHQVDMLLTDSFDTPASLSGDTAVVVSQGVVNVFERDPGGNDWRQTATLTLSDGTPVSGAAAIEGSTIVVRAQGRRAAYVFERDAGGHVWQEVAELTGDADAVDFGSAVAVSGTTVLVSSYRTVDAGGAYQSGVVYVFERDAGGPHSWGEVTRLTGPKPPLGVLDVFGSSVALDGDTAVIAARFAANQTGAFVFSRHHNGSNRWRRVAALPLPEDADFVAAVDVDGDTAVVGSPWPGSVKPLVFERHHGGPNVWGEVGSIQIPYSIGGFDLSDDLLLMRSPSFTSNESIGGHVFGRNQGGKNAWGEVANFRTPHYDGGEAPIAAAIDGDTVLLGNVLLRFPGWRPNPIYVYAADTDRDGVRDGADPCPRDPLNNVAESCQRASAVHPALDELIVQGEVTSETRGRRQIIAATFTNTSDTAIQHPFFEVTELTGGNVLLNGDAGRGRVGATLSPDVGDGILSPGESMTVTFRIRLRTHDSFQFFVTFHGDPVP
jgi:hypothetical protein